MRHTCNIERGQRACNTQVAAEVMKKQQKKVTAEMADELQMDMEAAISESGRLREGHCMR